MKAVRFRQYGGVDVLNVEEVELREPGPDDVVVRVRAAAINPGEGKIRSGALHEILPATFPSGEGSDFAGVVTAIGTGVTAWRVGDEVIGWSEERSSHAESVVVAQGQLVAKPVGLDWPTAGALYVVGSTAYAAVEAVDPKPGEVVAMSAAAGGVGTIAVQLVRQRGAHVLAIASDRHRKWLEGKGAVVVNYGDGLEARLRSAVAQVAPGHTAPDAFLDFNGTDYVRLAVALGVDKRRIDTIADFAAAAEYGVRTDGNAEGSKPEIMVDLARLAAEDKLEIPISGTYPLDRVRDAYTELEQGHTFGKIVLLP